ncbi:antibiotic biosynthesis monooxygenase [Roseospira marina]|uniref:Antibiotic biosynthesis monooxygenase n=1 Tax=Roseospira marina TaxID=140057 RepID=A0A5M6IEB1_9PROT|nr:antibiotic biosynthesis monooxygenase [Roseospira marina]KAA5606432.1 antibiotic biosynthesis monooxygenase [Roseospira marina]MBB4314154.1 heme-degrading monooxygenase HmoA [Roseospira marina]MBB5087315.1 heme-degrading monooxygenase HmoA [Roseospira marina]
MFIAMNRFSVLKAHATEFEAVWKTRESRLTDQPGFVAFHMLKGPEEEEIILYASHTLWRTKADFEAWTQSQSFRDAHKDGGRTKHMYSGGPRFEGFEVIQEVKGGDG